MIALLLIEILIRAHCVQWVATEHGPRCAIATEHGPCIVKGWHVSGFGADVCRVDCGSDDLDEPIRLARRGST